MFTVEIPGLPPSVNSAYVNGKRQGVRFKSDRYKEWEKLVISTMKRIEIVPAFFGPLSIEVELFAPDWWTVKGSPRVRDCTNFIKALEDPVFKFLGVNDSWVWKASVSKMDSNDFKTVMRIFELNHH